MRLNTGAGRFLDKAGDGGYMVILQCNDHHTYKRTYPLRNNRIDHKRGVVYMGDGCWGVDTRDVPKPGEVWYLAKAESKRHLICVTISDGKPNYVAFEANGKVIDQHS